MFKGEEVQKIQQFWPDTFGLIGYNTISQILDLWKCPVVQLFVLGFYALSPRQYYPELG